MPTLARQNVFFIYACYKLSIGQLIFNLLTTIIVGSLNLRSTLAIVFSILELIIGIIACSITLYLGYRGVAGDKRQWRIRYIMAQSVLFIFMVIFSFIDSGNIHGWMAIDLPSNIPGLFIPIAIIESLVWTLAYFFAAFAMYRVFMYPGHADWKPGQTDTADKLDRLKKVEKKRSGKSSKSSRNTDQV